MSADEGRGALRRSVAFLEPAHVALVEVRGAGAFAALDRLLPCDLHLADGQARPTLLLDDDGNVIADVTVARLEKRYLLFVDGRTTSEVIELVKGATGDTEIELRDARADGALISLHGPYAWELAAAWLGRSVAGIPPLALLRGRDFVVLRGGRTGEYGYEVLLTGAERRTAMDRLREVGARFDLVEASLEAFDACVLEAGGFVRRWIERESLSPFELQLQWRISRKKEHHAKLALDRRRASPGSRLAWFSAPTPVEPRSSLTLEGESVGRTLAVVPAAHDRGSMGVALLDSTVSHPGFTFIGSVEGARITTVSPPLVMATSASVRPQTDSYATRDRTGETPA